jgi:hypothetical protein
MRAILNGNLKADFRWLLTFIPFFVGLVQAFFHR